MYLKIACIFDFITIFNLHTNIFHLIYFLHFQKIECTKNKDFIRIIKIIFIS